MNFNDLKSKFQYESVVYKTVNDQALRILYVRSDRTEKKNKTALVWIHGGGWTSGRPELFIPHCHYFAQRGAVCFSIEYRLIGKNAIALTDCMNDVKSAIRYIRENADKYGINGNKIVVIGDSAGGHLATSLSTIIDNEDEKSVSVIPNVIVNCNGVVDLTGNFIKYVTDNPLVEPTEKSELLIEAAKKLSPLYHIKSGGPHVLNLQGKLDVTVVPEMTMEFHNKQLEVGNVSELVLWDDAKHAFILIGYTATDEQIVRAINAIDEFLVRLKYLSEIREVLK